jgi:hypothetical protein
MLFLHEIHSIKGAREKEFEVAIRDGWMKKLAEGDDTRLLWYCVQAHGTGPAYQVVTITAVRDGSAWEGLSRRVQSGDLKTWARELDEVRHGAVSKILLPVHWSPTQDVDLGTVPADGAEHEPTLYMEDTGWPHASLDDYIDFWHKGYYEPMRARAATLLDIQAVFQSAFGAGPRKEAILMQRIVSNDALMHLLTTEVPARYRRPGQFMHEALAYRDRWESKLLRTSAWSPFY